MGVSKVLFLVILGLHLSFGKVLTDAKDDSAPSSSISQSPKDSSSIIRPTHASSVNSIEPSRPANLHFEGGVPASSETTHSLTTKDFATDGSTNLQFEGLSLTSRSYDPKTESRLASQFSSEPFSRDGTKPSEFNDFGSLARTIDPATGNFSKNESAPFSSAKTLSIPTSNKSTSTESSIYPGPDSLLSKFESRSPNLSSENRNKSTGSLPPSSLHPDVQVDQTGNKSMSSLSRDLQLNAKSDLSASNEFHSKNASSPSLSTGLASDSIGFRSAFDSSSPHSGTHKEGLEAFSSSEGHSYGNPHPLSGSSIVRPKFSFDLNDRSQRSSSPDSSSKTIQQDHDNDVRKKPIPYRYDSNNQPYQFFSDLHGPYQLLRNPIHSLSPHEPLQSYPHQIDSPSSHKSFQSPPHQNLESLQSRTQPIDSARLSGSFQKQPHFMGSNDFPGSLQLRHRQFNSPDYHGPMQWFSHPLGRSNNYSNWNLSILSGDQPAFQGSRQRKHPDFNLGNPAIFHQPYLHHKRVQPNLPGFLNDLLPETYPQESLHHPKQSSQLNANPPGFQEQPGFPQGLMHGNTHGHRVMPHNTHAHHLPGSRSKGGSGHSSSLTGQVQYEQIHPKPSFVLPRKFQKTPKAEEMNEPLQKKSPENSHREGPHRHHKIRPHYVLHPEGTIVQADQDDWSKTATIFIPESVLQNPTTGGNIPGWMHHYDDVMVNMGSKKLPPKKKRIKNKPIPEELLPKIACDVKEATQRGSCLCGLNIERRIVGGYDAKRGSHPWIAGIFSINDPLRFCGGTIISEQWILTAAHCFMAKQNPKDLRIAIGDYDVGVEDDNERIMKLDKYVVNEDFIVETGRNDIALIKLSDKIKFTMGVGPACLPFRYEGCSWTGKEITVLGWGRTKEKGGNPDILQQNEVPVISTQRCRSIYKNVQHTNFCAYKDGEDTCQGDSGGPAVVKRFGRHFIIGVVSWGIGCARPNRPGIYTRVAKYLDWIETTLGEDGQNLCHV